VSEPDRQLFVVFGGTGDLARRKLLPALFRASELTGWTERIAVLGVGRSPRSDAEYRSFARDALAATGITEDESRAWCRRLAYETVGTDDLGEVAARIETLEQKYSLPGNRVFYLALPPSAVPGTVEAIGEGGLVAGPGWSRLVVEKPFGTDLSSAIALNERIHSYFAEDDVYRLDHYLGKETVQNLLVFRFANSLFERTWNRDHIAAIEITVAEQVGIADRAAYYDESGVVRDMVQNHLTQLLTLVAMEAPVDTTAGAIREEKVKALRAVKTVAPTQIAAGQVQGYRQLDGVGPASSTPTFVAMRLEVENWRWQGVPFLLRTGKELAERFTRIVVRYRKPPVCLFHRDGRCPGHENVLVMTLQPDEGFDLFFDIKEPGDVTIEQIPLSVRYDDWLGDLPDAYHTLLVDVIEGDQSLFVHAAEVEESWRIYSRILDGPTPQPYAPGSSGPEGIRDLASDAGTEWSS